MGSRLASRRETSLHVEGNLLFLLLLESVGEELGIVRGLLLGLFGSPLLERDSVTLALESNGRHKTLDLGGLCRGLLAFLGGKLSSNNVLANIVVLGEVLLMPNAPSGVL